MTRVTTRHGNSVLTEEVRETPQEIADQLGRSCEQPVVPGYFEPGRLALTNERGQRIQVLAHEIIAIEPVPVRLPNPPSKAEWLRRAQTAPAAQRKRRSLRPARARVVTPRDAFVVLGSPIEIERLLRRARRGGGAVPLALEDGTFREVRGSSVVRVEEVAETG